MSKKICHRDQVKLNQVLEQVEALSDIVDELRTELNHLKKISFNVNHENVCFKSVKENNKIDYASPSVLQKVKAYFENIGVSAKIDETCELTKNSQDLKKKGQKPIRLSTIYGSLKYFKNKIIKNTQNIRKISQSPKSTKNKCITSSQKQQEACLLRRKEKQKFLKFNRRDEDINKYISEELDNSADASFTSDASAQADITVCSRQEDYKKKSHKYNCLTSPNVIVTNVQTSPLSMIDGDPSVIYSNRFADELSKNRVRQTSLKNKIKKYRRCSCGEQCLYALYKLPCNKFRCSTPEKKVDEISGLTLECLSFGKKKDFPEFINIDTTRNSGYYTDSSPVDVRIDESLTSSLSVDLEVDICNDYCDLEDIDEFTKRRKARTYIVNRPSMRKDDLIKDFRTENEPSFNRISSWRNISDNKEKVDEIVKKVSSQNRYIHSEENNQGYKKPGTGDFISSHWPIRNNNKQIQCVIPAVFNRKISVDTSTSNFRQRGIQLCRTGKKKYNSFPKIIIPRMKANIQTQTDKRSCLNCLQNGSSAFTDCTNSKNDKNEEKQISRERNICDICAIEMNASSSQIIWPRMKRYIYSALQTEKDINIHSNQPLDQTCDSADWRSKITLMRTSYPYCCNHISDKKFKDCVALSNPTDYHPPSKTLDFNLSNVSGKLYDCLEKLEDIT